MDQFADRIKDFVVQELLFEDPGRILEKDTPLLGGIMDSLGLMELVAFLEEEFNIEVNEEDITSDRFGTISSIEALVRSKVVGS